jgi:hypothetical protein
MNMIAIVSKLESLKISKFEKMGFRRFLEITIVSVFEVVNQLIVIQKLGLMNPNDLKFIFRTFRV